MKFMALLTLLLIVGCGSPEHIPVTNSPQTKESDDSFAMLSANIFQPKCATCHSGTQPAGNVDLTTYQSIMAAKVITAGDPAHSVLYQDVQTGDMPDGGPALSANEVQAIGEWITAGAPDGTFAPNPPSQPTPPPPAPPTPPTPPAPPTPPTPPAPTATFTDVQTKILTASCTSCHSGKKPSGNIDLSSYTALKANTKANLLVPGNAAKSLLYTEVASGNMPPRGTQVSSANVQLLQAWINSGAPNN